MKLIVASIIMTMGIFINPTFAGDDPSQLYTQVNIQAYNGSSHFLEHKSPRNRQPRKIQISTFKIVPTQLVAGQQAKLIWEVNGADRVFIGNNIDLDQAEVGPGGYLTITPLKTTNYLLSAYDRRMVGAIAMATINVNGPPPVPIVSIDADTHKVIAGKKITLTWKTHFADTVSIDNDIGKVGSHGAIEIIAQKTTTYVLTAVGLGGSNIANITIIVIPKQSAGISALNVKLPD
jgi:hypothetical protein